LSVDFLQNRSSHNGKTPSSEHNNCNVVCQNEKQRQVTEVICYTAMYVIDFT